MSYSSFTIEKIREEFGVEINSVGGLFSEVKERDVSSWLKETLEINLPLATGIGTEKARSELLVMPVLVELWRQSDRKIGLFSGKTFNVDAKRGLKGACDYLITRSPNLFSIEAPVLAVVEAKDDAFSVGQAQCMAEMIAAKLFNEKKNTSVNEIFGAVTIGSVWQFLRFFGNTIEVGGEDFTISKPEKILGILWEITNRN